MELLAHIVPLGFEYFFVKNAKFSLLPLTLEIFNTLVSELGPLVFFKKNAVSYKICIDFFMSME